MITRSSTSTLQQEFLRWIKQNAPGTKLMVAAAIDAFGLLGSEKVPFVWSKWLGLALMIAGVLVFKWEGAQGAG